MRLMALLFAAVLLQTPQATTDPGFVLRPGAAGPFEVGSTVARVYASAGREKTELVDPDDYKVQLDTSKGPIVIAVHRKWAPRGADRFYELVTSGYYDDASVFRIRKGTWAQFGIAADPKVAQAWRTRTIPDDPYVGVSNKRGTVAFAFKDPDGRTTQVFINLKDNSETHDKEPFVVFGEVVQGMGVADSLYAEYGERAGGGIRAGKQDPVFEGGNAYLKANFPLLDYIRTARVLPR